MKLVLSILLSVQIATSLGAELKQRNLTWFEAQGSIEGYLSSDGKGGQRPKIVLFSHDWDMLSKFLKTEIVAKLKSLPDNNPILLDANCTDSKVSPYFEILKENGLRSLPIIGIHTERGWRFINPESEHQRGNVDAEIGLIAHLAGLVISETDG